MPISKQLTVYLENKPGQLAKLCKAIKVNILAISVVDTADTGAVRLVVDNVAKASAALRKLGLLIHIRDVLIVSCSNKPGVLATVAGKLAKAGINIDYAYGSAQKKGKEAMCVFSVPDPKKAGKILSPC
ncbi:MAG: ACT domain-containing protein [Candidatus Omnitrophica bacterium]|nr:ACT domain-containing protein [Candidatus Omnitrophota bacterium]MBU1047854.1 ACT domain-containing protein [Candidatus Omnitrophota bacterium]MBU1630201.1 ACT domain-containing protein [Candidatus Omnitrophota bacterium]MBU1766705.1 ACT domain-containing protein [Candidatus Omnitrophota bacterium]MBU1888477.1 ACT domain-containing protein [Candidatus Omnitrophota bacterium]